VQDRELERQRLAGGQAAFIADAFLFFAAVRAFEAEHK
jgi:hypothetical protein